MEIMKMKVVPARAKPVSLFELAQQPLTLIMNLRTYCVVFKTVRIRTR